jgi:uncharacterized protein YvpB
MRRKCLNIIGFLLTVALLTGSAGSADKPYINPSVEIQSSSCDQFDFDGNGTVDVGDIMQVASRWNTKAGDSQYNAKYDFDGDGNITVGDIMKVAAQWGCTVTAGPSITETIGSNGGTVELGEVKIEIPAGAVTNDTTITIKKLSSLNLSLPPDANARVSDYYEFNKSDPDTSFQSPVLITMPYIPNTPDENSFFIAYWNGIDWNGLGTIIDSNNKLAKTAVDHFTNFCVYSSNNTAQSEASKYLDIPYYSQSESESSKWCVYAASAMVLKANGVDVEPYDVAKAFGKSISEGYNKKELELLKQYLTTAIINSTPNINSQASIKTIPYYSNTKEGSAFISQMFEDIKQTICSGQPVIINLKIISSGGHAVVAVGYDVNNLYIHDPSGALLKEKELGLSLPDPYHHLAGQKISWDALGKYLLKAETEVITFFVVNTCSTPQPVSFYLLPFNFQCVANINNNYFINFEWNGKRKYGYEYVKYNSTDNVHLGDNDFGYDDKLFLVGN